MPLVHFHGFIIEGMLIAKMNFQPVQRLSLTVVVYCHCSSFSCLSLTFCSFDLG